MGFKFSKSDCCGEGAINGTEAQKKQVIYDVPEESGVGTFGTPQEGECFVGNKWNLHDTRKRRINAGRTLKAGS
jgi:hypothetical protein